MTEEERGEKKINKLDENECAWIRTWSPPSQLQHFNTPNLGILGKHQYLSKTYELFVFCREIITYH